LIGEIPKFAVYVVDIMSNSIMLKCPAEIDAKKKKPSKKPRKNPRGRKCMGICYY
jgi:hypothetical protein